MGVVVQFDWTLFQQQWPAYAPVGAALVQNFWTIGTTIHANDGSGPIGDAGLQASLLNALAAHLAQLYAPRDASGNPAASGSPAPAMVGRITSASEGSVSVQTEALSAFKTAQAQWLSQTQPGAFYWVATAQFRVFNYRPPVCRAPAFPYGAFPIKFGR